MTNQPNSIIKYALVNALLTALYVGIVGFFFHFIPLIFASQAGKPDSPLAPVLVLLLFVFSAAVCGALFLGRPVLWYLDGKKKEAVTLFSYTLGIFFVVLIVVFVLLYVFGG